MAQGKKEIAKDDLWDWEDFDDFRGSMIAPFFRFGISGRRPTVDIIDEGRSVRLKVDLPGVDKNDIKVRVGKSSVSISASSDKEREERKKNYYYRERSSSGYYRNIPLPVEIDEKSAKAQYRNGTLEITFRKKREGGAGMDVKIE